MYVWLNVNSGVDIVMEEWNNHDDIVRKIAAYLGKGEVNRKLEELKVHIRIGPNTSRIFMCL